MKEEKIQTYIDRLLEMGIFKIGDRQLYECSEKEIKRELFHALLQKKKEKVYCT
ncbi:MULTISPECIES: Fur-regulated basic protein FbpA [Aneurinibacillus]|jgi:hypothetical protein|uniref:Fur-regulated basic protein A n=3 Tax=Aneurinibacillus TaxID=55079 RepID=A0A1G8XFG3_ANEMI|nr:MULTISPECIES: Fur-regulated basic protein FbpA [Aneurinibacillus]ERI09761.1 hypothetical protein HMPREF0083_02126 [Aneurinibacillus aneurinilyticus ATCC 12856]MCI1694945.1 Fur-regulated basic protein FbpA [Aneurinibacillus aneurinilyticus]MCP1357181.1 Fur-regulated basic protein FbpA [Aneurinibacillus migulanus]MED0670322.1 Fur-regulated basic protein FbpA [Aneurinibacillus aneurinilyticus]MED0707118.1 Fur-regulated basic protein FbpA [Aneurinibacillus aneurinilyticus]